MEMTNGQRKQWAKSWLATARTNKAGQDVIAYWQGIIDECSAKAFDWLGGG